MTFALAMGPPLVDETVPLMATAGAASCAAAKDNMAKVSHRAARSRPDGHSFPDTIFMGKLSIHLD